MQRPTGIFVAGVILLVSGLLGLLLFSLGILGALAIPSARLGALSNGRSVILAMESVGALIALFFCWVGVGLFRMRSWARYSAIILAALGACFCGLSAVMMTLLQRMALPNPDLPPALLHDLFDVLALVYLILAAVAIFWIFYFNRDRVRAAFAAAAAQRQGQDAFGRVILPNRHHHAVVGFAQILLWIVAVLCLIGGACMVILLLLGMPMFVLGWLATGTFAFFVEALWACCLVYTGLGLLYRWPGGWYLAVALQLYSLLSVILLLLPGYTERLFAAGQMISERLAPVASPAPVNPPLLVATSAVGGLVALAILVALIRCRRSYLR